ncbi:hypothetical protein AB8O64_01090 [Streptomyces sp. QH1-20]|uniref:hypothetical protein n=1 Tax=Streptomyces sp. QH1-20 TaxID=3240934 RepID=UPI0035153717
MILVLATACGGGESVGAKASAKGAQESAASKSKATNIALRTTTPQKATWTDREEKPHQLRVAPKSLMRGSVSDLDRVRLDDELKGMTPYYLTVSFSNTSKDALSQPDLAGQLSVVGTDGIRAKGVTLFSNALATGSGLPKECSRGNPGALAAGGTAEVCTLVMLAKDQEPATVSYSDDGSGTALWEVGGSRNGGAGDVLAMGKTADATVDDNHGHMLKIKVTPKTVREGNLEDLKDFKLSGDKDLVPYYVTIEYRNTGAYDLLPSMQDDVVLATAGGEQVRPLVMLAIGAKVEQCPDSEPHAMVKPNATVKQCSIHMLPKGDRPAIINYKGDDPDAKWLTWRATS